MRGRIHLLSGAIQSEVDAIHTPLTEPLSTRLRNSVDVLIFNPPYVPTELEEVQQGQEHGQISSPWAGDFDGIGVANELLHKSEVRNDLLSPSSPILWSYDRP